VEPADLAVDTAAPEMSCSCMSSTAGVVGRHSAEMHTTANIVDERPLNSAIARRPAVKLSILMAVYNEERTILKAIDEILQIPYPCDVELIVINDGSSDSTPSLISMISDPRVIVHHHSCNEGKGASIISAVSLATGTHILPFDADLEYASEDIVKLLQPVINGRYDVVYGVRLFGCNTVYQSYRYAVGNKLLTRITNILYNSYLNDLHTCLKLIPLSMLKSFALSERGFGLDTQITALLLRRGIRPFEVPVSYFGRSRDQGKKIIWRDAVRCVWILVKTRIGIGVSSKESDKFNPDASRSAEAEVLPFSRENSLLT
jgi:dolichol-phosphate hexosyltransferase